MVIFEDEPLTGFDVFFFRYEWLLLDPIAVFQELTTVYSLRFPARTGFLVQRMKER